jgi:hypothetical protein
LNSNFLFQLAPQGRLWLFEFAQETAGNAPTTIGTKDMIKQEDPTIFIEDHGARSHGEASLAHAHKATPRPARQPPPDRPQKFDEHQTERIAWPVDA